MTGRLWFGYGYGLNPNRITIPRTEGLQSFWTYLAFLQTWSTDRFRETDWKCPFRVHFRSNLLSSKLFSRDVTIWDGSETACSRKLIPGKRRMKKSDLRAVCLLWSRSVSSHRSAPWSRNLKKIARKVPIGKRHELGLTMNRFYSKSKDPRLRQNRM